MNRVEPGSAEWYGVQVVRSRRRGLAYVAAVAFTAVVLAATLYQSLTSAVAGQSSGSESSLPGLTSPRSTGTLTTALTSVSTRASGSTTAVPSILAVNQERSGLVASDSLTTGGTGQWIFYGSAPVEGGIGTYSENGSGLYLGVLARTAGTYAGFYARMSVNADVFNAVISLPVNRTAGDVRFNTGLYVQTGGPGVTYVTCDAGVNSRGYSWVVDRAVGDAKQAETITPLWFEANQDQPLTRDCTIVTNGQNLLEVYLDHKLVYSNSSMDLGYQYPLSARVEVQSNDNSTMRFGRYSDFYAATSDNVTVTHAPVGAVVELVSPSGRVYFSKTAGASGTVQIGLAAFAMPLIAYVRVVYLGRTLATSRQPAEVWGGDAYTFGPLGVVALHRSGRGPEADPRAAARAPQSWRKRSP